MFFSVRPPFWFFSFSHRDMMFFGVFFCPPFWDFHFPTKIRCWFFPSVPLFDFLNFCIETWCFWGFLVSFSVPPFEIFIFIQGWDFYFYTGIRCFFYPSIPIFDFFHFRIGTWCFWGIFSVPPFEIFIFLQGKDVGFFRPSPFLILFIFA